MSLNLYTYCDNNPIIYFDPTGHWKKGDENLNEESQAEILALTNAYNAAITKEEKTEIRGQANDIRSDKDNYEDKDTLVEIDNINAFDNYMVKAMKDGKLSKKELTKANQIIDATVTTSTFSMEVYTGVNVTVTNTTTTIGKSDINVNTTITNNKATNQITTEAKVDTTNHYSAYVFYLPEWEGEMKDAVSTLASYYGIDEDDIGTASVTGSIELENAWNSIGLTEDGGDVSGVVIDTHANATGLGFGKINGDGTVLNTSDISNLENKNIDDLILLGCNVGHLDYKDTNPAAAFSKKINHGTVLACDGTVYDVGRQMLLWGNYLYQAQNDDAFFSQLTGTRPTNGIWPNDAEGWIKYQYVDGKVITSNTLCSTLTIKQMLNLMK